MFKKLFLTAFIILALASTGFAAAVRITGASDVYKLSGSRYVVRTASAIYVLGYNTNATNHRLEMWKSTTGASWAEVGSGNRPATSGPNYCASMAIDATGVIHVVYGYSATVVRYATFQTSTDTWDNYEACQTAAILGTYCTIAVDSSNYPHVAFVDSVSTKSTVYYTNRTSGSWSSVLEVYGVTAGVSCTIPGIAIDSDNIPVICFRGSTTTPGTGVSTGDANNPTTFGTPFTLTGTAHNPSVAIDSSGNHYVAYCSASAGASILYIRSHTKGDGWTTWAAATAVSGSNAYNAAASMAFNGTVGYILVKKTNADVGIKYWDKSSGSWAVTNSDTSATAADPKVRWANYGNLSYSTYPMDYVFSDGTDIYWNSINLIPASTRTDQMFLLF